MSTSRKTGRIATLALATTAIAGVFAFAPGGSQLATTQALAEAVTLPAPQQVFPDFADVVSAVSPAVVSVRVEQKAASRTAMNDERMPDFFGDERIPEFFRNFPYFFDRPEGGREGGPRDEARPDRRGERADPRGRPDPRDPRGPRRFGMGQGSGFFISEDGLLVTNNHVVSGGAKFTVVMDDGTEFPATLVGGDERSDLALLKVEPAGRKFTYVKFAETAPRVGEWVVAVGNPFGLGGTVTAGIVSASKRTINSNAYDDYIQIDAAVNRGNSGGPAFNLKGEVIGINTAIFSPSGGNVGIAFAIPSTSASRIIEDLQADGKVVRGWLGVQIQPVSMDIADSVGLEKAEGAIVAEPQSDSPAAKAGIETGDVILAVDGKAVKDPRELSRTIAGYAPGSKVKVTVWRDSGSQDITVELGTLGAQQAALAGEDDQAPEAAPEAAPTVNLAELGLKVERTEDGQGVRVADVSEGSGAAEKGMENGDVILSVNGEAVAEPDAVARQIADAREKGRKAALFQVRRGDNTTFVAIPLAKG